MSFVKKIKRIVIAILIVSILASIHPSGIVSAYEGDWIHYYRDIYCRANGREGNTVENIHGSVLTGLNYVDGDLYYFREDGRLVYGDYGTNIYNYYGVDYYYEIGTGKLTPLSEYTGLAKYYRYLFYFVNGKKQTGWQQIDSKDYYFIDNGKTGYGRAATGKYIIDGTEYEFDDNGVLVIENDSASIEGEWKKYYNSYRFYTSDTEYVTGFQTIENKLYYFNDDGQLLKKRTDGTDVNSINGVDYYFYDDNSCVKLSEYTGLLRIYAHRYVYIDGVAATGWQKVDGDIYYAGKDGKLVKGTQKIQDINCYFDDTCKFISSDEEVDMSNKQATIHVDVPEYNNTSCGITAEEWNDKTTYGWNLGNALSAVYGDWDKSKDEYINQETMWGQPETSLELIEYVKSLGFNSIRVPVTFYKNTYLDDDGTYHINDQWLDRVAEVVQMCLDNDMTVYICPMCDSLGKGPISLGQDEETMKDVYSYCEDIWTDIADKFKNYDGRLAFEGYNEVWIKGSGKTVYTKTGHEQMNYINQIFVDTVRKTGGANADRILIVPSYGHEYDYGALNDFVLPKDTAKDRLIVSVHEYAIALDQQLDSIMRQIYDFQEKIGAPVMINEWGFTDGMVLNNSEIQKAAYSNFSYISDKYGIKSYVWDNGAMGDFGIISRVNYSHSDMAIVDAIMNPKENITKNSVVINDVNDEQMNLKYRLKGDNTGIEYHPWWGFLTFGDAEHGYVIPEGSKYFEASILKHTTDLKAIRFETYTYAFYDENDNYVGGKHSKTNGCFFEIPENAKYVRVLCYNQFEECKAEQIENWFDSGELAFYAAFYE